jgi:hypothetical protein
MKKGIPSPKKGGVPFFSLKMAAVTAKKTAAHPARLAGSVLSGPWRA